MDEQKELYTNSPSSEPSIEPVPDIDIPTLRTYKSDINQTVNKDKITTAKILIAEQNKKKKAQENESNTSIKRPTNILVLIVSVLLIIVALGGIGYVAYTKVVPTSFAPVAVPESFLFVFDFEKFIDTSKDKFAAQSQAKEYIAESAKVKDESYTELIFYKTNPTTDEKTRITTGEFFALYDVKLPTNIARSISKDFVYGVYKTQGKMEPFVVVGVAEYETLYSALFVWENTLALDIKEVFPVLKDLFDLNKNKNNTPVPVPVVSTATSTTSLATSTKATSSQAIATTTVPATSTPLLSPEQEYQKQLDSQSVINRSVRFIDIVFSNKDARAIRGENGTPFFYYAFIDRSKLLFAQDPKLLNEISRKIKEKSLVR